MPELRRLLIGDRPEAWSSAGFTVDGDRTTVGSVAVRFVDDERTGVVGWELADVGDGAAIDGRDGIDGIATAVVDEPAPTPMGHPNGVTRLDHVVIATTDLDRTIGALEGAGFEVRRHRDVPGTDPVRRQVFLWAGEPILEVVGPAEPTSGGGNGPDRASVWGLALTTDDIDRAAERLGPHLSGPKPAVQPGRRIATVDTAALGIGPALALMTPHVG